MAKDKDKEKTQEWSSRTWKNLHLAYKKYAITFSRDAAFGYQFRMKSLGGAVLKDLTPKQIGQSNRYRVEVSKRAATTGARVQAKPRLTVRRSSLAPVKLKYKIKTQDLNW